MSEPILHPILHHYPASPFSEKVRLVLGAKRLAWRSVHIPVVLPKPDVVALTGGYRKTPLLQIGADVYCDSALICRVLDRLAPEPPLYPDGLHGLAETVAQWADGALFWTCIHYTLQPAGLAEVFGGAPPDVLKAFGADRAAFTTGLRRATPADAAATLQGDLARLESMLAGGRAFLLGGAPTIADFSSVHGLWFVQRAPTLARVLDGHPRIAAWLERMRAFGHGAARPMAADEALAVAAAAAGHAPVTVEPGLGFEAGAAVTVAATDVGRDPVAGRLVGLSRDSVTLERDDARAGRLHVHFPRRQFQIRAQPAASGGDAVQ